MLTGFRPVSLRQVARCCDCRITRHKPLPAASSFFRSVAPLVPRPLLMPGVAEDLGCVSRHPNLRRHLLRQTTDDCGTARTSTNHPAAAFAAKTLTDAAGKRSLFCQSTTRDTKAPLNLGGTPRCCYNNVLLYCRPGTENGPTRGPLPNHWRAGDDRHHPSLQSHHVSSAKSTLARPGTY